MRPRVRTFPVQLRSKPIPFPCPACRAELARTPTRADPDLIACTRCPWQLPAYDPVRRPDPPPCPTCGGERVAFADPDNPESPELVCVDCPLPFRVVAVNAVARFGRGDTKPVAVRAVRVVTGPDGVPFRVRERGGPHT